MRECPLFHQPSLVLPPRFVRQHSRQGISSCQCFRGRTPFPRWASAITKSHVVASATFRDSQEIHTSCPPKTAGQQCDSIWQLCFQRGPFFRHSYQLLKKAPEPVWGESCFIKYCHGFCIVHIWACLMWVCMSQMSTAGHSHCHLQINLTHARFQEKWMDGINRYPVASTSMHRAAVASSLGTAPPTPQGTLWQR